MEVVAFEFSIGRDNAAEELQECLAELSNLSLDSTGKKFELIAYDVRITPRILALLVQVLNHPLPKGPFDTNSESKWDFVKFDHCRFTTDDTDSDWLANDVGGYCSPDKRRLLGEALARRTLDLKFNTSPEILECLCKVTSRKVEIEKFFLTQTKLSTLECEGLGDLIQRCNLKCLLFCSNYLEAPHMLVEPIGNATHLHELTITRGSLMRASVPHAVYDIVPRLLQNSQNQLQELCLTALGMDDRHFIAIVELLPTSRVAVLDVRGNSIHAQGILAFAAQLPWIKSLKKVKLTCNPWEDLSAPSAQYEECIAALVQGMSANYFIEHLHVTRPEKALDCCSHINWIRREILGKAGSIPAGLWPLILEKIGTRKTGSIWLPPWDGNIYGIFFFEKYGADELYFVLQSSPILSLIHSLRFLRRSQRKRRRVVRYY